MKKITFLFTFLLATVISFGQNLVTNGDFEADGATANPTPAPWAGFKNRIILDNLTSSYSGQVENGDGSLFQLISGLTPGATYDFSFNYRWVGAGGTIMTVRVKDELNVTGTGKPNLDLNFGGSTSNGFPLLTTVDTWESGAFSITLPAGVNTIRLLFFKGNGNRPLNLDNISATLNTLSVSDLAKFNFKSYPNPAKDYINLSASKSIEKIEVYNLLGQEVLNENINSNTAEVNITTLSKGMYVLKAFIEGAVGSYKFTKN